MSKKKNKSKRRGHYCRICDTRRPNEKFSGKGHSTHICQDCQKLPKAERDAVDQKNEIYNFLNQKRISERNIKRLRVLTNNGADSETMRLAEIVLEVAKVRPYKKRRLKILGRQRPDLLRALGETDLIMEHGTAILDMPFLPDPEEEDEEEESETLTHAMEEEEDPVPTYRDAELVLFHNFDPDIEIPPQFDEQENSSVPQDRVEKIPF
mgnify:CR=1 FL=1